MQLIQVVGRYAICRLDSSAPVPPMPSGESFISASRTPDELSMVCEQAAVPPDVPSSRDWACLRVAGTLALTQTGVLSAISAPLADAGIPIFVVSTFDTDYLLVPDQSRFDAARALRRAGHAVALIEAAPVGRMST